MAIVVSPPMRSWVVMIVPMWVAIVITVCRPTRRSILLNINRYSIVTTTVITYGEGEPIDASISS
jgi:hypothetical protein